MKKNRVIAMSAFVFCAALTGFIVSNAQAARSYEGIGRKCGPDACLDVYNPVTCSNGVTYPNACYAAKACAKGCGYS